MPVTRSARVAAAHIKPLVPSKVVKEVDIKVEKRVADNIELTEDINETTISTTINNEERNESKRLSDASLLNGKRTKVLKSKVSLKKATKQPISPVKNGVKASRKPTFEDSVAHIEITEKCQLPQSFIDIHTPEFIKGVEHILSVDPSLYAAIVSSPFEPFRIDNKDAMESYKLKPTRDQIKDTPSENIIHYYWYLLIRSVISQQVSGAAALSIRKKVEAVLDYNLTPQNALSKTYEQLRGAGLSNAKVKYVTHISEVFADDKSKLTDPDFYTTLSLDELYTEFVALKGIGLWSAKMFALFTLKEMDVFAHEDLGIARGVARYFERRPERVSEIKKAFSNDEELKLRFSKAKKSTFVNNSNSKRDWTPHHDEYVKYFAENFAPYRSVLMLILWRLSSTNVETLDG